MTLGQFAEQFVGKTLRKTYQRWLVDGIANRDYQGDIKKPGDRVNILSFLNDILMSDYVVGSDMASETIVDAEDQLIVEKRRYHNFSLDSVEMVFSYGADIPDNLLENASKVMEREADAYLLNKFAEGTKAGNWVGLDLVVAGSGQTMASIATSATGGTVTLNATSNTYEGQVGSVENPRDGNNYFGGFDSSRDLYKGFRLRSTAAFVSPWYRISAVTSSTVAALTEWDEATSGSDFEEGFTLRGLFGGDGVNFPKYGDGNASLLTMSSLGWEFQAAIPTAVTAATIYDQVTLLSEALDAGEVTAEDRHITLPPQGKTMLLQASELQPTGIVDIYNGTVLNARVGRIGNFEVHLAAGARLSTRAGHSATSTTGPSADLVLSQTTGYQIPANHKAMATFAEKWTESRVVEAENQFAKKYQGLWLYGALIPRYRRKYGAMLFGSF